MAELRERIGKGHSLSNAEADVLDEEMDKLVEELEGRLAQGDVEEEEFLRYDEAEREMLRLVKTRLEETETAAAKASRTVMDAPSDLASMVAGVVARIKTVGLW